MYLQHLLQRGAGDASGNAAQTNQEGQSQERVPVVGRLHVRQEDYGGHEHARVVYERPAPQGVLYELGAVHDGHAGGAALPGGLRVCAERKHY